MIKKTETIQVRLTNYGTIDVVSMPTRIYKDSYNVMKLSCIVPKVDEVGARICKVYEAGEDEAGNTIFTSAVYNLPYKEEVSINGFDYIVYEDNLPQKFCANEGDVTLTFAEGVVDGENEFVRVNVSGSLNLFINGVGYNYAGVKISNYDVVASKVNEIISNYVKHEELQAIDDKITNLDIPENLSDLNNDMGFVVQQDIINALIDYYKKSETYSREEVDNLVSVTSSLSILVVDQLPTEDISTTTIYLLRNNGESPNLYDEYIYVRGQWEYLGSQSFEISANTLAGAIEDSESIVSMVDGDKLKFELDADLTSKISKSLTVPMSAPSSTELVAIDDGNSQTMISIGSGLKLEDGVLSSTGGGTSSTINVVNNLSSQSTTDALSAKQGNVLYNMIVESGNAIGQVELDARKQLLLGANGVLAGNVYSFTVENANDYLEYRTNLTKFLIDLNLPISGAVDTTKEVAITFGDTTYYVFNVLKGMEHATIGDLHQVDKYNNETGYRFIAEMTFFENQDVVGFAIIPTISMSDVLALDSDQMDNYMADGGLTQGQMAVCKKVITNGYEEGAIYRFDIMYPNNYSWTKLSGTGDGSGGAGTQVKVAGQVQSEINFNTDPVAPVDFAEAERQKSETYGAIVHENDIGDLKGQVLWENSTPTVDFVGQTVTLSTDNYDYLEIIYRYSTDYDWQQSMFVEKGAQSLLQTINTPDMLIARITGIVGGNSLQFEKAFLGQNGHESVYNNYLIPVKIIGYKRS